MKERASSGSKRAGGAAMEVGIAWGDTVLRVVHLAPPRSFFAGDGSDGPVDLVLPASVLGAARVALVQVTPGGPTKIARIPGVKSTITREGDVAAEGAGEGGAAVVLDDVSEPGWIAIEPGMKVVLELGDLTVRFEPFAPLPAVPMRRMRDGAWMPLAIVALSMLLHVGLLGFSFSDPAATDAQLEVTQAMDLERYLLRIEEKELEAIEAEQAADALADGKGDELAMGTAGTGTRAGGSANKEGGTGTRAKGEEGSMGSPSGQRFGVQGPSDDPHLARQADLRDAAEFGMIGLLNSGAGGDPNAPTAPWGRDDSLGAGPVSARGNQWGAEIGDSFGGGGLGLSGIGAGAGGGGRGEGIGLGSIGTIGRGASPGTGQGFGSGSGRLGGSHRTKGPSVSAGPMVVGGGPPLVVGSNGHILGGGSSAPSTPEPVAEEGPIDPNGRFATTYRPGGGHLAAFEAAVASGMLPAAERELVSDLGGGYAPSLTIADGKALAVAADLERSELSPSGGAVHVRLALRGTNAPSARPHLSVHLVLDVSGSMEGEAMNRARIAAAELANRLAPTDDFSLVTFSTDAKVVVPDGPVGSRREAILERIRALQTDGGTNISEGLRLGYEQAMSPSIPADAVKVVLLLSDGRTNAGIQSHAGISRMALEAFQHDIQTSTFGIGTDYDGALMSAIASDGAGGYYYLRDAERIGPALATELEHRLDPVATAVELRVRLKDGVDLLKVYGSRRLGEMESARVRAIEVAADQHAAKRSGIEADRKDDTQGGMRFLIPAFAKGDSHALLLKLALPAGVDRRSVATIELKYKDRVFGKNVVEELPLSIGYAVSDAASAQTADGSVARTVQAFVAGEALMQAAARVERGDRAGAAALLLEREQILHQAAATLGEPRLATEALRLGRLRHAASPQGMISEPLALAMLLETAGRSRLH